MYSAPWKLSENTDYYVEITFTEEEYKQIFGITKEEAAEFLNTFPSKFDANNNPFTGKLIFE